MEHWVFEPEMLKEYAKHYETGGNPQNLSKSWTRQVVWTGFATVEYLAASFLDMDFHVLQSIPEDIEPITFENKVLGEEDCCLKYLPDIVHLISIIHSVVVILPVITATSGLRYSIAMHTRHL